MKYYPEQPYQDEDALMQAAYLHSSEMLQKGVEFCQLNIEAFTRMKLTNMEIVRLRIIVRQCIEETIHTSPRARFFFGVEAQRRFYLDFYGFKDPDDLKIARSHPDFFKRLQEKHLLF